MSEFDLKAAKEQAARELAEERNKKAVVALKGKLRMLEDAKQVVRNIEREIEDLEVAINDGSFA